MNSFVEKSTYVIQYTHELKIETTCSPIKTYFSE